MSKFERAKERIEQIKMLDEREIKSKTEVFDIVYANMHFIKKKMSGMNNFVKYQELLDFLYKQDIIGSRNDVDKNPQVVALLLYNGIVKEQWLLCVLYCLLYTAIDIFAFYVAHKFLSFGYALAFSILFMVALLVNMPFTQINLYRVKKEDV